MAESKSIVVMIPLNGNNYATWRIQCKMALMREGLWCWRRREICEICRSSWSALAIVVLSVEPNLLYLLGEPKDPAQVWKTFSDQFMKKSWGNKLELQRKLHSLRLNEGESVQEHNTTNDGTVQCAVREDRVIYLLASLQNLLACWWLLWRGVVMFLKWSSRTT